MLRRHIVLLIAIRPSDVDIKPGGPLGAFREDQAMSRHRVSPSPFLSSSSHTTQIHYTNSYTYSHHNLNILQHCTDTLPTRNVVCPSSVWFENRPHLTPSIRLARNPKRVIVLWVGINTHTRERGSSCPKMRAMGRQSCLRIQQSVLLYSERTFLWKVTKSVIFFACFPHTFC